MINLIDRRLNGRNKSAANRERFLRRYKEQIRRSVQDMVTERYGGGDWNVYLAQASDGDAFGADAGKSARFLADCLLPLARYFAYIEVRSADDRRASSLWAGYEALDADNFAMRHVGERSEIYPVFRELFSKEVA